MDAKCVILMTVGLLMYLAGCGEQKGQPAGTETGGTSQSPVLQGPPKDQLIEFDVPPQLVRQVVPKYPDQARERGIEGKVLVKMLIGVDGIVKQAEVIQGGSAPELTQSALDAAKEMKFSPAQQKGRPVAVWVTVPFKFELKKTADGEKSLSDLKNPNDVEYVEGYLEALRTVERQIRANLESVRARKGETREIEKTLENVANRTRFIQTHLDKLRAEKSVK